MIKLTNKQRFILNNLLVLVAVILGIALVVACINMPINQNTNDVARILFSVVTIIVPLFFYTYMVIENYILENTYNFDYY